MLDIEESLNGSSEGKNQIEPGLEMTPGVAQDRGSIVIGKIIQLGMEEVGNCAEEWWTTTSGVMHDLTLTMTTSLGNEE